MKASEEHSALRGNKCPLCGGTKKPGKTVFSVDLGFGVVVVRDVPATVCSLCSADWIDDATAEQLEDVVSDARQKHHMVEITSLPSSQGHMHKHC